MPASYYNENDPQMAAWLRELIVQKQIPSGDVDERSIEDVTADDLRSYRQCHFFAGIGGWALALQLAGWPGSRRVWTGSCPCQPFSAAGKRGGADDPRALWWAFRWLIDQCRPATLFGEQVASKAGRVWLAGVRADLEAMGYAVGAADLCAAGVGAPHIRQRLWWVGYANNAGPQGRGVLPERPDERAPWEASLGYWIPCADGKARRIESGIEPLAPGLSARVGLLRGYGNSIVPQIAAEFIQAFLEAESTSELEEDLDL